MAACVVAGRSRFLFSLKPTRLDLFRWTSGKPETVPELELTLAIVKPDVCKHPFALQEVRKTILYNNFLVLRTKLLHLTEGDAETFYAEHVGKFFYNRLVTYMSSGPIFAHVLAREGAIKLWRELMGPTKTYRAIHEDPNSIRGSLGLSDTRNATHGSDSASSAQQEIRFFFPDFDVAWWSKQEESLYQFGNVKFDRRRFIHYVIDESTREKTATVASEWRDRSRRRQRSSKQVV